MKPVFNKRAIFDYEILKKYNAGLVLNGQEVKSIKKGNINLQGSYVVLKGEELFLIGANVPPYQPKNAPDYEPQRSRKLLLTKSEINKLIGLKGLTLVPLRVYTDRRNVKLEFAVAKSKKKIDKREKIKKRETDREIDRELKRGR